MSAVLLSRPRPAINYGNKAIRPPKGTTLVDLEAAAWSARDRGIRWEIVEGLGPQFRLNKAIAKIQQLIIEQYGWPDRG